jgi:hypothetical protein
MCLPLSLSPASVIPALFRTSFRSSICNRRVASGLSRNYAPNNVALHYCSANKFLFRAFIDAIARFNLDICGLLALRNRYLPTQHSSLHPGAFPLPCTHDTA